MYTCRKCSQYCHERRQKRQRRRRHRKKQQRRQERLNNNRQDQNNSLSETQQQTFSTDDENNGSDRNDEEEGQLYSNNNSSRGMVVATPTAPPPPSLAIAVAPTAPSEEQEHDLLQATYHQLLKHLTTNRHMNCSMIVRDGDLIHETQITTSKSLDGKCSVLPPPQNSLLGPMPNLYNADDSSSDEEEKCQDGRDDDSDNESCTSDVSITSFRTYIGYLLVPKMIQELHGAGIMTSVPNCCAICVEGYKIGDSVTFSTNPQCCHAYHTKCISSYLARMNHNNQHQGERCGNNNNNNNMISSTTLSPGGGSVGLSLTNTDCPTCRRPFLL